MNITPPAASNVTQLAITVTSTISAELRAELAYNLVCFLLALIMTILVLYAAFFCLCLMFDWWPCCPRKGKPDICYGFVTPEEATTRAIENMKGAGLL